MKTIALITNYNIQEKLSAAMKVAEFVSAYADKILIPLAFKDRIMRSRNHRSG